MPVINRIAEFAEDMKTWRRHIHAHPELGFDCHGTAAFVVERLREMGVDEIHEGIATSGVVAVIEGQGAGPVIGLRADMDALPIMEETGAAHASTVPGKMHACGHDGHTTMLLGAARYLAETRRFKGRVVLLFQPAEENGGGGNVMVEEGALDHFGVQEVYGIHTSPLLDFGHVGTNPGALMAAVDEFEIVVEGRGGHGARPENTADPLMAGIAMAQAIQTIVSRNRGGTQDLVISVTQFHAGSAFNVIPHRAVLGGTVRTYEEPVQDMVETRMRQIVEGTAAAMGVTATVTYTRDYPATVNHAGPAMRAAEVARSVTGHVDAEFPKVMGAEDFSYMLRARPGAFLFFGQGKGPGLHHPEFDFNDDLAPVGASFFACLVETQLPLE